MARTLIVKDDKTGAVQDDIIKLAGVTPLDVLVISQVALGVTAAGSVQGDATALTAEVNEVGTTGLNEGVILPVVTASFVGRKIVVKNNGANSLDVYPPVGGDIDGAGANAPAILATGVGATFYATSSLTWSEIP